MPLTLYQVRGISGEYNLFLPEREDVLLPLPQEVPLRYAVLEGKHLGGMLFKGAFVKLSGKGGEVRCEHPVALLSEMKMRLMGTNGEEIPGDLYGKLMGKPMDIGASFSVPFTSVLPEVVTFLHGLLLSSTSLNA